MNDLQYPELFISNEIRTILNSTPDLPKEIVKPEPPKKPYPPSMEGSGKWFLGLLSLSALAVLGWSHYSFHIFGIIGTLALVVTSIVCPFGLLVIIRGKIDLPEDKRKYEIEMMNYNKDVAIYNSNLQKYNKDVSEREKKISYLLSDDYLEIYRIHQMYQLFCDKKNNNLAFCKKDSILHGPGESFFYSYIISHTDELFKYVGMYEEHYYREAFCVYDNVKVPISSVDDTFYYPDIVIQCGCFLIDIEIDEPYEMKDGTPIHFVEGDYVCRSIDDDRNRFFIRHGWSVIRFAEEQVIKQPQECLNYIISFMKGALDGKIVNNNNGLISIKKWTKDEAHNMAYKRFRYTYLE